jgi:hypothetical protein
MLSAPSGVPAVIPLVAEGKAHYRSDFVILDGNGALFVATTTSVTVPPMETQVAFSVEVIDDGDSEVDEDLTLRFGNTLTHATAAANARSIALRIPASDAVSYAVDVDRESNDTGAAKFASATWNMDGAEPSGFPRQDASNRNAFSFTKLDANGEPPLDETTWSCVKDNVTGLIWEAKLDSNGELRSKSSKFTWYNSDDTTNGGNVGDWGYACTAGVCNTAQYVAEINRQALCGKTGWRLPTLEELRGLYDYGGDYSRDDELKGLTINQTFFADTHIGVGIGYWSSTPSASSIGHNEVWSMGYGLSQHEMLIDKATPQFIRLVNDGR